MAQINKRSEEFERIERELRSVPKAPPPKIDLETAHAVMWKQLADLSVALRGDDADATLARESIRALIDRIVITPVGEATNAHGHGPVSIEITGRWANLVGLAEPGESLRVQLATDAHSQLNPHEIWRIEFTKAFAGAINVVHQYSPVVLAILSKADEPMTIHQIVDVLRRQMAIPVKKYNRAAEEQNLRKIMQHLIAEGRVYAIILSGKGHARAYALREATAAALRSAQNSEPQP
ncbi:hypothetical protein GCM10008942_19170 [Rhizomicrobium electricum]|uniref:Uncharacterized protein n=2 Tax=Rhizomicrobium electricum TaxID=480070 RepID=A0ABN1EPM6_9PROT